MLAFACRSDSLYVWSPAHRPLQTQWLSPGSICLVSGLAGSEPPLHSLVFLGWRSSCFLPDCELSWDPLLCDLEPKRGCVSSWGVFLS